MSDSTRKSTSAPVSLTTTSPSSEELPATLSTDALTVPLTSSVVVGLFVLTPTLPSLPCTNKALGLPTPSTRKSTSAALSLIVTASSSDTASVAVSVVNVAASAVVPPMTVLSIVPSLISAVSATRLSMLAVPSMYKSLNCNAAVPKLIVFVVLGTTSVMVTLMSCAGPTTEIGAPSPTVPSCVWPDVSLNAV